MKVIIVGISALEESMGCYESISALPNCVLSGEGKPEEPAKLRSKGWVGVGEVRGVVVLGMKRE